ncbi:hypothetical protein BC936DRAFT_146098 [Jimgerdemannia flammicorona]|uniref:Uncharacterized protein n=1 Tax=Jimgerdemannia flammicorona TaxID=994334 RepID=A0A433D939_9FUNG|nr:hypothetical protein BC936DRAFT_146098 [Jimgerdemannia flammicorona]
MERTPKSIPTTEILLRKIPCKGKLPNSLPPPPIAKTSVTEYTSSPKVSFDDFFFVTSHPTSTHPTATVVTPSSLTYTVPKPTSIHLDSTTRSVSPPAVRRHAQFEVSRMDYKIMANQWGTRTSAIKNNEQKRALRESVEFAQYEIMTSAASISLCTANHISHARHGFVSRLAEHQSSQWSMIRRTTNTSAESAFPFEIAETEIAETESVRDLKMGVKVKNRTCLPALMPTISSFEKWATNVLTYCYREFTFTARSAALPVSFILAKLADIMAPNNVRGWRLVGQRSSEYRQGGGGQMYRGTYPNCRDPSTGTLGWIFGVKCGGDNSQQVNDIVMLYICTLFSALIVCYTAKAHISGDYIYLETDFRKLIIAKVSVIDTSMLMAEFVEGVSDPASVIPELPEPYERHLWDYCLTSIFNSYWSTRHVLLICVLIAMMRRMKAAERRGR